MHVNMVYNRAMDIVSHTRKKYTKIDDAFRKTLNATGGGGVRGIHPAEPAGCRRIFAAFYFKQAVRARRFLDQLQLQVPLGGDTGP
jgi:hypothetical protein